MARKVDAKFIVKALEKVDAWYGIHVPEFTYDSKRIDLAIINTYKRWVRGFEIKVTRSDFLRDTKWQDYTEFTSSLTIVCPEGLIAETEIVKPFGLLYVSESGSLRYIKKPKKFQRRDGLAWLYTYVRIIEKELPRLQHELNVLKSREENHVSRH